MYQAADYHSIEIHKINYIVKHETTRDNQGQEQSATRLVAPNGAVYLVEAVHEKDEKGKEFDTGYRTVRPSTRSDSALRDEEGRQVKLFQVADMLEHVGYFD